MATDKNHKDDLTNPIQTSEYAIVLPCSQEDFGGFVSGLLGKSQTIEKVFKGTFDIGTEEIENTFHLLDQRIRQQNDATLVQFTVKIIYDDDSSILLNSFEDFIHYAEVRPILSMAANLSWTYLIRFQDKKFPEKQQIELSIYTDEFNAGETTSAPDSIILRRLIKADQGHVAIRISHTARTWGIDIESLLTGHIQSLMKSESKLKQFIYNNDFWIGAAAGILFFVGNLISAHTRLDSLRKTKIASAQAFLSADSNVHSLMDRLNFLIEYMVKGDWQQYDSGIGSALIVSLLGMVIIGVFVGTTAGNRPKSFLLLSRKAIEARAVFIQKRKRGWVFFIVSIISGIVTGVIANLIYAIYFKN